MPRWSKDAETSLATGVLALAATYPIEDISVAQLCQRAGITRDTFYRYASRPIDALAKALSRDMPSVETLLDLALGGPTENPLRPAGRAVLDHIDRNRAVYRNALHPHLDSALRDLLVGRIEGLLAGYLAGHPAAVPLVGSEGPNATERHYLVVFTAAGIVGAVEEWVGQETQEPTDRMLDLLFAAAAPWWRD